MVSIKDLLAGAPELVLARLGPEMIIFLLRAYSQDHQNWLWLVWDIISINIIISLTTTTTTTTIRITTTAGQYDYQEHRHHE